MSDRPSIEKEISDIKKTVGQREKEIKQLRDWISANERSLNGMTDALRRITEDGITRARADLAQRENEMQQLRTTLADNERLLNILTDIERKGHDIAALEREQEKIIVLLERHRAELVQLQMAYEDLTRPVMQVPCELVLPNNQRIPLDAARGSYLIGWQDGAGDKPDIDLHALGGSAAGVSRRHAVLRFQGGQWAIEDLASTNGSFLNESPLAPHTATPIPDKTTVRLGNVRLFFRYITQTTRL